MELLFNGMINQPASDRNSGHVSIILIFRIIVIATFIAFASELISFHVVMVEFSGAKTIDPPNGSGNQVGRKRLATVAKLRAFRERG